MQYVMIKNGQFSTGKDSFRDVTNLRFPLVNGTIQQNYKGTFILVDGTPFKGFPNRSIKIFVQDWKRVAAITTMKTASLSTMSFDD